jgi:hypothetical protein
LQSISSSLANGDTKTAQISLDSLMSKINRSKLSSKGVDDLSAMEQAIAAGDQNAAQNALKQIQLDSQPFLEAYQAQSTTNANTTSSTSTPNNTSSNTLSSYV